LSGIDLYQSEHILPVKKWESTFRKGKATKRLAANNISTAHPGRMQMSPFGRSGTFAIFQRAGVVTG